MERGGPDLGFEWRLGCWGAAEAHVGFGAEDTSTVAVDDVDWGGLVRVKDFHPTAG